MLLITQTINHRRPWHVQAARALYANFMITFCQLMHIKYRLRTRVAQ